MKKKAIAFFLLFITGPLYSSYAQPRTNALKLPKALINFEGKVSIMKKLSDKESANEPWIVYSDRGADFGQLYYVTEEENTRVHIVQASGCNPGTTRLINPVDKGWRNKEDLMVYFGAEFTEESNIHKKCVILNNREVVDKIVAGELNESEIPLYNSPDSKISTRNVPLYYIYFIYKTDFDNKRFLIGKNYFCRTYSFSDEIFGWVDMARVHEYNTRICFEPNYEESAVRFRRCNPTYSAKVFPLISHATAFLNGDTSVKPFWTEPKEFFFRNPEYKGNPAENVPFNFDGENLPDTLLAKLCGYDVKKAKESKILTGRPLPGYKFRFPLIDVDRKSDQIFLMGVAGRMDIKTSNNDALCKELKLNKRKINIYFILDNSIDRNKLLFPLGQIQQGFSEFEKTYGVCFYPSTPVKNRIDLGEKDKQTNSSNFEYTRDFIIAYKPENPITGDNYLKALKRILNNQKFESNKTNILVIINNGKVSNSEFSEIKDEIQTKLAEKNCFIVAYDYSRDESFKNQVQEIMMNANNQFAKEHVLDPKRTVFEDDNGIELMYTYLLAVMARKKENVSGAAQMDKLLERASKTIIDIVDQTISLLCNESKDEKQQNQTGVKVKREDPFVKGLLAIANKDSKVEYVRYLEQGWGILRYKNQSAEGKEPVWKADVLFTREELQYIATALDKLDINQNNSDFSKKLYDLYVSLFNRFVGEDISEERLRENTPQQIMNDIIGSSFGYNTTDKMKLQPLGRILSNDQQMQGLYESFKKTLQQNKNRIAEIIKSPELVFCLDEVDCVKGAKLSGKNIYYYWVPIEVLP